MNERLTPPDAVSSADILVIGGGIAGLSAAAALSSHARVMVLEAEEQIGFHSSGRSATMIHYALGDRLVRALTLASRPFFDDPPDGFQRRAARAPDAGADPRARGRTCGARRARAEISRVRGARPARRGAASMSFARCSRTTRVCGIADRNGIRLDPHALLQGNLRSSKRGGTCVTGQRIARDRARGRCWTVTSEQRRALLRADPGQRRGRLGGCGRRLAGVQPLGLEPKRRTIITFDAPPGTDLDGLPFAKTVGDELYFAPESGRLFASPMDEVPSEPCDAQPEEYEVALAAHRMEERTTVKVARIHSRWAGLRTFTPDRHPAVGFRARRGGLLLACGAGRLRPADLAGDGARSSTSLIAGTPWPVAAVAPERARPRALPPAGGIGRPSAHRPRSNRRSVGDLDRRVERARPPDKRRRTP